MRKLPILLFTAVFALSLALPAYAAESSNEELKAASQYLNSHGIMVGDGEGGATVEAALADGDGFGSRGELLKPLEQALERCVGGHVPRVDAYRVCGSRSRLPFVGA